MGAPSALESGQRLLPDTPPALVSPGASTFSSTSSPKTEALWNARPLASPPMSDYDKGSKAAMSGTEEKPADVAPSATSQAPQAQKLPSLSSLFGPPTSRPVHSPMSDRHSLPTASPMDRQRLSSHGRGHGDSYFPPTLSPPISQPRSSYHDSERPSSLHSLRHSTSGPGSPGFRSVNHGRSQSRGDTDASTRGEYTLDSRSPAFKSSRDFRLQFPGHRDGNHSYQDQRTSHQNPPPTPTSTTTSEGIPTKDGLGPKIWTGTHFLPRFVRAAEVPGEGLCYFYDDGSHCKTMIDGEAVNAHWGVTKAGKPRKRLAIACVTCREKKIKCDPDFPRCVQCEKFGRICKFKNAPRGGHNGSPTTPPAELHEDRLESAGHHDYRQPGSSGSSPLSPRTALPDGPSAKRVKVDHHAFVPSGEPSPAISRPMNHSKSHLGTPLPPPEMPRIPESVLSRAWQTDPYVTDPQSINAVMTQFFAHIDSTMILQLLPERTTKTWVASSVHRKSPEDLMLVYSMLAVGVALSGGPKSIAYEYAQVAHHAHRSTTSNCLQVAQSRILLAVYYISVSRRREANEVMSAAAHACTALQLNLEFDRTREAAVPVFPLALSRAGYSESRRRTMWSLFMLERLSGWFPDRMTMVSAEDMFIRLPADLGAFEQQLESVSPMFDPNDFHVLRAVSRPQEVAAYLVQMVHLWAEAQSSAYKLVHRPAHPSVESSRVRTLLSAISHWRSAIPNRLESMAGNLEDAAMAGQLGSFLTMHLLCNHALIKLNRYNGTPRSLSPEMRRDSVEKCQHHAMEIVQLIERLDRLLRARPMTLSVPPPMIAAAVSETVDVLSSSSALASLDRVVDSMRIMKPLVDTMCNVWEESRSMRAAIEKRLHLLNRIRDRASHSPSAVEGFRILSKVDENGENAYCWEIFEPLERLYGREVDLVYGFE